MVLVGYKSDVINERVITAEDGQSMAEILGVRFFETSAMLENSNVDDIFAFIISKLAVKEPYCTSKNGAVNLSMRSKAKRSCKCDF